jgi:hypothetical protein
VPDAAPEPQAAAADIATQMVKDDKATELLVVGRAAWKGVRLAVEDKPYQDQAERCAELALACLGEKDVADLLAAEPAAAVAEVKGLISMLSPGEVALLEDPRAVKFLEAVLIDLRELGTDDGE